MTDLTITSFSEVDESLNHANALRQLKTPQEISEGVDSATAALSNAAAAQADATQALSEAGSALIQGSKKAFEAIKKAASKRVDVVMIGDSNQRKDGYGFMRGLSKALGDEYGYYATNISYDYVQEGYPNHSYQIPQFNDTVEPNHEDAFIFTKTSTTDHNENTGNIINSNSVFDLGNSIVRFWLCWAGYPTGTGSFQMKVRYEDPPYSTIKTVGPFTTNTGSYDKQFSFVDLLPSEYTQNLRVKGGTSANSAIVQPMSIYYQRAEQIEMDSGVSLHTLFGVGGDSSWDMAAQLQEYSDNQLTGFFYEARRLQIAKGQTPTVVVYINTGLNDRNETNTPTRGEYKLEDPQSAAGYADNISAIMSRVEHIWQINGWNMDELSFLLVGSHIVSDPFDAELTQYRAELEKIVSKKDNASAVNLEDYMTYQQAVDANWYLNPVTETEHLDSNGYDAVSQMMLSAIKGA